MAFTGYSQRDLEVFMLEGIPQDHAMKLINEMYTSYRFGGYGSRYNIADNQGRIFTYEFSGRSHSGWVLIGVENSNYENCYVGVAPQNYTVTYYEKPKKKEPEPKKEIVKASKQIRHQFLKRRLAERNNTK